jgi:uracil-DNA glycosylase family 4
MADSHGLLRDLRQLLELDRAFGIEFMPRIAGRAAPADGPATMARMATPAAPATTPAAAAAPVPTASAPARPAAVAPVAPSGLPAVDLDGIAAEIESCRRCPLGACRTRSVPGEGNPGPELLFVGEGPGAEEDAQGRPFVGPAGQLLTRMIEAMGLARSEVFIANVVKCRPPGNRTPGPEEVAHCMPFLRRQIAVLRPRLICTLGNTPLRALMGDDTLGISRLRGQQLSFAGIPLIPTFHPSYLLRNPAAKKPCWEDLQTVLKALGRTLPPRRGG